MRGDEPGDLVEPTTLEEAAVPEAAEWRAKYRQVANPTRVTTGRVDLSQLPPGTTVVRGPVTVTTDEEGRREVVPQHEPRSWRSWATWRKSLEWRAVSTITLFFVGWLYTGSLSTGGVVAAVHCVITIVLYVPHDLWWERRLAAARAAGGEKEQHRGT